MKKILAAFLCAAMALSLSACNDNTETPDDDKESLVSDSKKDNDNSTVNNEDSNSDDSENSEENSSGEDSKPEDSTPEQPAANEADFGWFDLSDGTVSIQAYTGSDENVIIPSTLGGKTVTQIGSSYGGAFKDNIDITSVTIPASVELIYASSFSGCINLSEVKFLGDKAEYILVSEFKNTPWLAAKLEESKNTGGLVIIDNVLVYADQETAPDDVVIPDGVTRINRRAFANTKDNGNFDNSKFTSVTIPDSVTRIDNYAFAHCINLKSLTIPDSVTKIGNGSFYGCKNLESLKLSAGITVINNLSFAGCTSLKSIDVPNGVTKIEGGAFGGYSGVVNLPDTITSLADDAFTQEYNVSIKEVTFKGNTYTYSHTISSNDSFRELYSAVKQNAIEIEFGGKDFIINGNVLEKVNPNAEKIELPDSVTDIADDAFSGCNQSIIVTYKGKNYNLANLAKLKEDVKGN